MRMIIALAALLAVAVAAPAINDKDAVVVRSDLDNIGVEGYKFGYETSNGIAAEETAQINNLGGEQESIAVQGQFSYIAPDGVTYTVKYIADENGFQPQGAHLPQ